MEVVATKVHRQFIHCKVTMKSNGDVAWLTVVYGVNGISDRKDMWTELVFLGASMDDPWCIMGDFNAIYDVSHRSNGRLVSTYEMKDFQVCIAQIGIISPHSVGHWFSWHNKGKGDDRITSRIDHAFLNELWLDREEITEIQYLNPYLSDHSPIVC